MGEREKEMITKGKTRERKGMGWTQGERRGRERERGDGELIVMEDKVKGDGEGGHRRKSWR